MGDPVDDGRTAALALCEAASRAPWGTDDEVNGLVYSDADAGATIAWCHHRPEANAAFIVAARTSWPAALDEIGRLTKKADESLRWEHTATLERDKAREEIERQAALLGRCREEVAHVLRVSAYGRMSTSTRRPLLALLIDLGGDDAG